MVPGARPTEVQHHCLLSAIWEKSASPMEGAVPALRTDVPGEHVPPPGDIFGCHVGCDGGYTTAIFLAPYKAQGSPHTKDYLAWISTVLRLKACFC